VHSRGFAHLFEHLMFGGSENVSDFDEVIQHAGGENNAFTNADYTNFYEILPVQNIESAMWVEADRMANLIISEKSLDVQRKVVVEEFKEVCLNTPYGDVWHHLSAMSYQQHPYQWPTIGKTPDHIENAQIDNVSNFYQRYYSPDNAILSIGSSLSHAEMIALAEKWFSDLSKRPTLKKLLPIEPVQHQSRAKLVESEVPIPAIYLAFPMPHRLDPQFYVCDLLTDLLAAGKSSKLYQNLIKNGSHFSGVNAYISGTFDPGLLLVEGKPMPHTSIDQARDLLWAEINKIKNGDVSDREITKLKNKLTTEIILSNLEILNKAMILSYFEALGDADLANTQIDHYSKITKEDVIQTANEILMEERVNELVYLPK